MKRLYPLFLPFLLLLTALLFSGCSANAAEMDSAAETDETGTAYENALFYDLKKEAGIFDMIMFRVGKADAVLLSTENHSLLVDCGERNDFDAEKIIEYCKTQNITVLDAVIVSNLLTDNIGGFEKLAENLEIKEVIAPAYNATGHRYTKFLRTVMQSGAEYTALSDITQRTYDDLEITFYPANNPLVYGTEQEMSLVLSLVHGKKTFLLTGNIRGERITEIMETITEPYDLVKLPDHGFLTENSETVIEEIAKPFLVQYAPEYVLISDSSYHPVSYDLLSLLADLNVTYYKSSDAYVCVRSNTKRITIEQK